VRQNIHVMNRLPRVYNARDNQRAAAIVSELVARARDLDP
jgi:hypothetical protein